MTDDVFNALPPSLCNIDAHSLPTEHTPAQQLALKFSTYVAAEEDVTVTTHKRRILSSTSHRSLCRRARRACCRYLCRANLASLVGQAKVSAPKHINVGNPSVLFARLHDYNEGFFLFGPRYQEF